MGTQFDEYRQLMQAEADAPPQDIPIDDLTATGTSTPDAITQEDVLFLLGTASGPFSIDGCDASYPDMESKIQEEFQSAIKDDSNLKITFNDGTEGSFEVPEYEYWDEVLGNMSVEPDAPIEEAPAPEAPATDTNPIAVQASKNHKGGFNMEKETKINSYAKLLAEGGDVSVEEEKKEEAIVEDETQDAPISENIIDEGVLPSFNEPIASLQKAITDGDVDAFQAAATDFNDLASQTFGLENITPDALWDEYQSKTDEMVGTGATDIATEAISNILETVATIVQDGEEESLTAQEIKDQIDQAVTEETVTNAVTTASLRRGITLKNLNAKKTKVAPVAPAKPSRRPTTQVNPNSNLEARIKEMDARLRAEEIRTEASKIYDVRVNLEKHLAGWERIGQITNAQKIEVLERFDRFEDIDGILRTLEKNPARASRPTDANPYPVTSGLQASSDIVATRIAKSDDPDVNIKALLAAKREELESDYFAVMGVRPVWTRDQAEAHRKSLIEVEKMAKSRNPNK